MKWVLTMVVAVVLASGKSCCQARSVSTPVPSEYDICGGSKEQSNLRYNMSTFENGSELLPVCQNCRLREREREKEPPAALVGDQEFLLCNEGSRTFQCRSPTPPFPSLSDRRLRHH